MRREGQRAVASSQVRSKHAAGKVQEGPAVVLTAKQNRGSESRCICGMRDEENGEEERGDLGEGWAWAEEAAAEQSRMDID